MPQAEWLKSCTAVTLIIERRCCSFARSLRLSISSGGLGRRAMTLEYYSIFAFYSPIC
jgi:hypothetical protein